MKITKLDVTEGASVLVSIYGFLTTTSVADHLPVAVTTALVAVGPAFVTIRAWLDHPSTGNGASTSPELRPIVPQVPFIQTVPVDTPVPIVPNPPPPAPSNG